MPLESHGLMKKARDTALRKEENMPLRDNFLFLLFHRIMKKALVSMKKALVSMKKALVSMKKALVFMEKALVSMKKYPTSLQ